MPTFVGKEINGFFEGFIGYTYKEVDEILVPTESYKEKIKEYQELADSEDCSIEEAWNGLGYSNSWKQENKELLISCMIKEKKLMMIHNRREDKFYYRLI
jgi:hypothetical protein